MIYLMPLHPAQMLFATMLLRDPSAVIPVSYFTIREGRPVCLNARIVALHPEKCAASVVACEGEIA